MITLLIATRNSHKVEEIRAVLGGYFHYLSLVALPDAPRVVENAATFAGNAQKKARELTQWLQIANPLPDIKHTFVLADDSGLEVDALSGAPGVLSARFAAQRPGNSPDADNNAKLLALLGGLPAEQRTARFRCAIALVRDRETAPELFEGTCEGRIELAPRGTNGFGYDPLFVPDGYSKTFGELTDAEKNKLSHRARALDKMKQSLRDVF
jgi:XTP/dITP diphosphohydrolase